MSQPDVEAMAGEVVLLLKSALAPVLERLQKAEAALDAIKAEGVWHSGIQPSLADARERLAALEARPSIPGPTGEAGPPGKDGIDGRPGLTYQGVYQDGKAYELGDVTTWAGSTWHCNEATETKPGDGSKAWTLMVKRGRDGKDGGAK